MESSPKTATFPCLKPASVGLGGGVHTRWAACADCSCAAWAGSAATVPQAASATTMPPVAYRRHPRAGLAFRSSPAPAATTRFTLRDISTAPFPREIQIACMRAGIRRILSRPAARQAHTFQVAEQNLIFHPYSQQYVPLRPHTGRRE